MPVALNAARRTIPVNVFADQAGAVARPSPTVPVPSINTASTVPHALNRPFLNCVAPTNTVANAGKRYDAPAVGDPELSDDARITPANPEIAAETKSEQNLSRFTLMFASRAASGLNPVA
jgi:hypothetical protein